MLPELTGLTGPPVWPQVSWLSLSKVAKLRNKRKAQKEKQSSERKVKLRKKEGSCKCTEKISLTNLSCNTTLE